MEVFISIVGCPRSGTTLLRNMLNSHPDIFIFPQTQFFNKIWGSRRLVNFKKSRKQMLNIIAEDRAVLRSKVDMFSSDNLSRERFDNFYVEYIDLIQDNNDLQKRILGDKTPRHIFFQRKIKENLNRNVKTIIAVRDSRAVVASLKKRGLIKSIEQGAAIWNSFLEQIVKINKEESADDIMCIRYEDIVADPKLIANKMALFLNLEYSENMLDIQESNSSYTEKQKKKGIYKDSIDYWKNELQKEEIVILSRLTKKYLQDFNYHVPTINHRLSIKSNLTYKFFLISEKLTLGLMEIGFFPTLIIQNLKK
jgi:hypothetical protein